MIRKLALSASVVLMAASAFAVDRPKEDVRDAAKTHDQVRTSTETRSAQQNLDLQAAVNKQAGDNGGVAIQEALNNPSRLGLADSEGGRLFALDLINGESAGMTPAEARKAALEKRGKTEKDLEDCAASMK